MTTVTLDSRKSVSSSYLATPAAVRVARRAAERTALGWNVPPGKVSDVGLVVSELFTNAARAAPHAEVTVTLAVEIPGTLTVEVHDPCDSLPQARTPGESEEEGRGLLVVAALACHHGARREPGGGKAVFAVLEVAV
jgi:anti-sigma regulatory factor (Ser/Thr protein kinase)